LTPSFAKILLRCHSTVRGLMKSRAPMSWFGQFFANQSDDVGLLGCELTVGSRLALAGRPARGLQFPGGALGECLRSHQAEYVVGGAQAVARVQFLGVGGAATHRRASGCEPVPRESSLSETGRLRLARCVVEEGWPRRRSLAAPRTPNSERDEPPASSPTGQAQSRSVGG
jgi:hypothetical protein